MTGRVPTPRAMDFVAHAVRTSGKAAKASKNASHKSILASTDHSHHHSAATAHFEAAHHHKAAAIANPNDAAHHAAQAHKHTEQSKMHAGLAAHHAASTPAAPHHSTPAAPHHGAPAAAPPSVPKTTYAGDMARKVGAKVQGGLVLGAAAMTAAAVPLGQIAGAAGGLGADMTNASGSVAVAAAGQAAAVADAFSTQGGGYGGAY